MGGAGGVIPLENAIMLWLWAIETQCKGIPLTALMEATREEPITGIH